jgi:hypothetical protein
MIRQIAVAACVALLGFSGQAMAAQSVHLTNVKGTVLVNQNGRYVPVTGSTTLRAGDRVMAMNGGASLTYANGCATTVAARSMVTISDAACGADVTRVQYGNEGRDRDNFPGRGGPFADDSADLWLWLGFGILTAAVMAYAFGNDNHPVSP